MELPLVSIIIPLHNAERYIAGTIQSTIDQTWPKKEIIIINDGSTDNSLIIAKRHECDFIKVYTQQNKGASATRNLGLQYAKGEYIQFLDADDLLSSNKIEVQIKALQGSHNKLAVCSTAHFKDGENYLLANPTAYEDTFLFNSANPVEFLINLWGGNRNGASMIQTNAWLVPRTLINKNEPWEEFYSPDDDGEYFSRLILASNGIIYCSESINYYRKLFNGENLSNRKHLKGLTGCYQSLMLKKNHLFSKTTDERAKFAIASLMMGLLVDAYPEHLSLSKKLMTDIEEVGVYHFKPKIGGFVINLISNLFGWKIAKKLSYIKNKSSNITLLETCKILIN